VAGRGVQACAVRALAPVTEAEEDQRGWPTDG
jgi:hypothetical protein